MYLDAHQFLGIRSSRSMNTNDYEPLIGSVVAAHAVGAVILDVRRSLAEVTTEPEHIAR
jgi:hypothetical protein